MSLEYFQHGVASGDPRPTSVVLWTRVTPTSLATPGSGRGPAATVMWEVARSSTFATVVRRGTFVTDAKRDHTVKLDATGLSPARNYWYRFSYGGQTSRVGRFRTAPAEASTPTRMRFGVVSCANLQAGWFSAYRHLAARNDLHAILHLGDYLYEYAPGEYGYTNTNEDVRPHRPAKEIVALRDYRQRHAQYKQDPDLQALHARYAFINTWDDHESANDAWRDGAENHQETEGSWAARKAASHRAYDEWMPVRMSDTAALDSTRLFRRLRFGTLLEVSMLDLRTYRDQQLAAQVDPEQADPDRTIAGRRQLDWLKDRLVETGVQWKVVGNPVMIAPVTFGAVPRELIPAANDVTGLLPHDGAPYNVDQWDGYTDDRREVFEHLRDHGVTDTLFVTGDIHSGWACDLPWDKATYAATGDSVAVEFVATSVTSNNLKDITGDYSGASSTLVEEGLKANNPHIKHLNFDDHGFSVLDVTPARAQMDWYVIGDRADRQAGVRHEVSYVARAGTQQVSRAEGPVA